MSKMGRKALQEREDAEIRAGTVRTDDGTPLWVRLDKLAQRVDEAYVRNAAGTAHYADADDLDNVRACLEEMSTEVFNWCRARGLVL